MGKRIEWTCENVPVPELDMALLERWLEAVVRKHGRILGPLVYIFCDDEKIVEVNRKFLEHDYYTDIITFDYSRGKMVSGDMFISLDTVKSNATDVVKCDYFLELKRVIVHGLLHLCGIDDKAPGEREVMEMHEDNALALLDDMIKDNSI